MKSIYRHIANEFRMAWRSGQLRQGDLLPSTRQLAQQRGIHRHTVMNAYEELVAEGWLECQAGKGYVVGCQGPPLTQQTAEPQYGWDLEPFPIAWHKASEALPYAFPSGQPDLRIFPHEEYYAQVRSALRRCPPEDLLGYSPPAGRQFLRQQLADYLRRARGLKFDPEQLIITHGCQEAVYLLARTWLRAGDVVVVEEQGFPRIWEAFRCCGAQLVPVKVDEQGLCTSELAQILQRLPVRLIYCTPQHQYPSTVTLTPSRRQELLQLAQQHQVPILEDDYDFEFHYRGPSQPPLKIQDSHGLVVYCSTFSKVLHPSARLGFAIAPPKLAHEMAKLKCVVSRQNDNLAQEAVAGWMAEGGMERHLRRMLRHYQQRRSCMLKALCGWSPRPGFTKPSGGMCFWVDCQVDTARLAQLAQSQGVQIRPGQDFRLDGQPSSFCRLGFAYPTPAEIEQGISLLGQARASLIGEHQLVGM